MRVRSYAKVNLGLAIGPVRADGFHGLCTLYQTIGLHDLVTVTARRVERGAAGARSANTGVSPLRFAPVEMTSDLVGLPAEYSRILLTSNDARVPLDGRNTAWRMVEGALERLEVEACVEIHIEKRLPVQGGMGAGSANAAAALIALERELDVQVPDRMELAAEVGSDVPLFLVGGAVLGEGRGELVEAYPDFAATWCVVAVPEVGVSTPQAFKDWDAKAAGQTGAGLTGSGLPRRIEELSRAYASCSAGPSGIFNRIEGLAENQLLALVRTGIENDFEEVVFPQHPLLREIKRELMDGEGAVYAALSGSGSAVFGLYESDTGAKAAQQRVQALGVKALVSQTIPREAYWREMFAE